MTRTPHPALAALDAAPVERDGELMTLRWTGNWADIVGADGSVITDILGRLAPTLSDEVAAHMARVDRSQVTEGALAPDWALAERHGLQAVLACARQSAVRAVRAHLTVADLDLSCRPSDRWSRWQPAERGLKNVCSALVLRRYADPVDVAELAHVWTTVMGELPPHLDMEVAPEGEVKVVTEAEAGRQVRLIRAADVGSLKSWMKRAEAYEARAVHAERYNWPADSVRRHLAHVLNSCPSLPAKARTHIEEQFGVRDEHRNGWRYDGDPVPVSESDPTSAVEPEPADGGLFVLDGAQ